MFLSCACATKMLISELPAVCLCSLTSGAADSGFTMVIVVVLFSRLHVSGWDDNLCLFISAVRLFHIHMLIINF